MKLFFACQEKAYPLLKLHNVSAIYHDKLIGKENGIELLIEARVVKDAEPGGDILKVEDVSVSIFIYASCGEISDNVCFINDVESINRIKYDFWSWASTNINEYWK